METLTVHGVISDARGCRQPWRVFGCGSDAPGITVQGYVCGGDDLALEVSHKVVPEITRAVQQRDRSLGIV